MLLPSNSSGLILLCSLVWYLVNIPAACHPIALNNQAPPPDLGMIGANTLSLAQEQQLGEEQKRLLRRHFNFINDPLLNEYLNHLGQKIAQHTAFPSPFHFYLIHDQAINAFATFGGNIYFYTGLLQLSRTESQLASVIAHEVSHVTQRHLASYLEQRQASNTLSLISTASAILLSMLNQEAGMALLTSSLAGNVQQQLSFTQQHEREADTLGLSLLIKSGFAPQGMVEFMELLADQQRFSQSPPEFLLTHPLPNTRIAYVRNRITLREAPSIASSLAYYLAKIRLNFLLETATPVTQQPLTEQLIKQYQTGNANQQMAAQYGEALLELHLNKLSAAQQRIRKLQQKMPNNIWFLDLATDIHLALKQPRDAIKALTAALKNGPEQPVLQLNLIQAAIEAADYTAATNLLHRYTHAYPDDLNGWALSVTLYGKTEQLAERYTALAELVAIQGDLQRAITLLITASQHATMGSHTQARIDARIDQLSQLQQSLSK